MLSTSGLFKTFQKETVVTIAYLINISLSTTIKLETPQEIWSGKSSKYAHLRIFGCIAYVHKNEGKLEPRALKCIFIGYFESVKGYKLWINEPGK